MPSPQHLLSKNCDEIFHHALNNDTVLDMHRIQGSAEGELGGPPANNNNTTNNNNPNDQESLEDKEPTEFVLKDQELFIILKAVSILVIAVIAFSLAIFAVAIASDSTGYPATNKLQKECILGGLVGFVPFSVITVGLVHSVEGRANAIDLATTMVIAEITYGFFAVCIAAMVIAKVPWFIVVPLFLVVWLFVAYCLASRYRRPRGIYVMLKKIFKFKMHGQ